MRHLVLVFTNFHYKKLRNKGQYLILMSTLSDYIFRNKEEFNDDQSQSWGAFWPVDIFVTRDVITHPFSKR